MNKNTEELIKIIASSVLNKLQEKEKQALVVFTGGALGFNESLDQLEKLQGNGWKFKIVLSRSAENIFKKDLIKKKLSLENIYLESENEGLSSLYQDTSMLLIPTLTMNTAAKISLGISDSLATNLASRFIMEGLPIIAATDACNPEHPYRIVQGETTAPASYIHMFQKHLETLKSFGVKLVAAKDLQQAVMQYNHKQFPESGQKNKSSVNNRKRKVITRTEVMKAKEKDNVIEVFPNSIVTALARETAEIEGVKIIRSGE